jgi:predicted benzoate:H+ symporter BenE
MQSITETMQSIQSIKKHAAMKMPNRLATVVAAAFGLLSVLLPVRQDAHAQGTTPADIQAAVTASRRCASGGQRQ